MSAVTGRRGAVGAALVAVATVGIAAAVPVAVAVSWAQRPRVADPAPSAVAVIATLDAPSVAGPLPDSTPLDATTYVRTGECAATIEAYLAPGAPLPAASTAAMQGGSIVVTQPFAVSGVRFTDTPDGCRYTIEAAPTVTVDSSIPGLPSGRHFSRVLCGDDSDPTTVIFGTEIGTGAAPVLLSLTADTIAFGPGSLATAVTQGEPPVVQASVVASGSVAGGYAFDVTAAGGTAHIEGRCTGSAFELINA